MRRDIVLQLCNLLLCKSDEIRMIFGMCNENYKWKSHSYFVKNRPRIVSAAFIPFQKYGGVETKTSGKNLVCEFTRFDRAWRTVFLDLLVTKGIFRWSVQIVYADEVFSTFCLGMAPSISVHSSCASDDCLGSHYSHGSCSFQFWRHADGLMESYLRGVEDSVSIPREETAVRNKAVVTVEADSDVCTLSFFVDGIKIPRTISDIAVPFHFGMSGLCCLSFTTLSFLLLPHGTHSPVQCVRHRADV